MLKNTLAPNILGANYQKFNIAANGGQRVSCYNLPTPVKYSLTGFLRAPILYVTPNKVEADAAIIGLSAYFSKVVYLPAKPDNLVFASAFSSDVLFERFFALKKIAFDCPDVIVATVESLMGLFPDVSVYKKRAFTLKKGDETALSELSNKLVLCGYERKDVLSGKGTFSIKGDIVDIYLPSDEAYRLDFFGDELESVRRLDTETLRSGDSVESLLIYPCKDSLYELSEEEIIKKISQNKPKVKERDYAERLDRITEELELSVGKGISPRSEILPLVPNSTVFDYLAPDTAIIFDEFNRCYDVASSVITEHISRFNALSERGEVLTSQRAQVIDLEEVVRRTENFRSASLNQLLTTDKGFKPQAILSFKAMPTSTYSGNSEDGLARDIKNWLKSGYKIVIAGKDEETAQRLSYELSKTVLACYLEDSDRAFDGCVVCPIFIDRGFILHEAKTVVIGTHDLIKKAQSVVKKRKNKKDAFMPVEIGDYVVHELHGIGKLKSVSTVRTGNVVKDYAVIEYYGGDILYLPCEQMESLVRFSGTEKTPKLSKIGGKDFGKIKEKVKASVREMAINLKELYAEREEKKGFVFEPDSPLQQEFEDAFPYTDTPDQRTATAEIKADMTSGKIMDRLLVGDVGFGKTEVAFRAAFKAIENGKQAVLLAPTTILCYQHYKTAIERFKGFGVRIDYLNRFKTESQINDTLARLRDGKIDFLISTHRVLSKDVEFYDLALLILDEEQRFGVEDKEKIKTLKKDVDVLSMSATPIPRTLHMSLSGIRDISTIETPPMKRIPPEVIVCEQTDGIIYDACIKELSRGGQVFILYNRVNDIYSFASKVQNIVDGARIVVAHGQMPSGTIEQNIEKFVLGEYDILIATTIIENGIDIPRANTMIVIDSDKFGLSTAYQLKGRVGRSDKLAYVYFTFRENKVLSENAYKRLEAIREYTEFGSGFKIAMRDLEIRGSGNILGKEQHGHMEKVGYDMYCKLLSEARDELEGKQKVLFDSELDVQVSAYIPEEYVQTASARLEAYKNISSCDNVSDMEEIKASLTDVYGAIPEEVDNLCKIALLKHVLSRLLIEKFVFVGGKAECTMSIAAMSDGKFLDKIEKNRALCRLEFKDKITLRFSVPTTNDGFNKIYDFFLN